MNGAEYIQREIERHKSILLTNIKATRLRFHRYKTIWNATSREGDIHLYVRLSFQDKEEKRLMVEVYDSESIKNLREHGGKKEYIVLSEKSGEEILPAVMSLLPEISYEKRLSRTFILNLEEKVIN